MSASCFVAVVNSNSGVVQDTSTGVWSIKISYGPRWITYLIGVGGVSFVIWMVFWYLNTMQSTHEEGIRDAVGPTESQQTPLLACKDDDLASWGSSYDGFSQDDEYNEDGLDLTASQGKQVNDGEYNNNIHRLCAICFDAASFFHVDTVHPVLNAEQG